MSSSIDELVLADEPARWEALGFGVCDGVVEIDGLRLALAGEGAGRGILSWSLRGIAATELDGLPTTCSHSPARTQKTTHPNGVDAVDHVVAMTPALDRSVDVLRDAGLDLRRIREQPTPAGAPRQAFFRLGSVILEVVQVPEQMLERFGGVEAPARFWGLALIADDLERTVAAIGEHVSEIRPAVQSGRRIATLRRSARLAVPVALMSRADA